ncbi:MAG: helix-turn-helix transcriptional regulator [Planctomycetia bacterium]|nr:helix-turn-helix transcriptional regulator [Planctomycetia bacterium]
MTEYNDDRKNWLKDPEIREAYDALEPEYSIIRQTIAARMEQNMTQAELAARIGTKQSCIARVESGNANLSIAFLKRIAAGLGKKVTITFS